MKITVSKVLFVLCALIVIACGGGGGGETFRQTDRPTGIFRGVLNSRGTGDVIELEIAATDGVVTGTFARLTQTDGTVHTSSLLTGTAQLGDVDVEIDFGSYGIFGYQATFASGAWSGTYSRRSGDVILESGDLVVTQLGEATISASGPWAGIYTVTSGPNEGLTGSWEFQFDQVGNQLSLDGTVDGITADGSGTIVGTEVSYGTLGSFDVDWRGTIDDDRISGTWESSSTGDRGTFSGVRSGGGGSTGG